MYAADHGLASHAVSAYPREVTRQMVTGLLDGGAAVAVLARPHGLDLTVVGCGTVEPPEPPRGSSDAAPDPARRTAATGPR